MGREIRRVPTNWNHPKRKNEYNGREEYHPMFQGNIEQSKEDFQKELKQYYEDIREFEEEGRVEEYAGEVYSKINGNHLKYMGEPPTPPNPAYYMPTGDWYQLFEDVSEGTPITPPFETEQELINWLSENEDFWKHKWTREGAEHIVRSGFALSGIMTGGKIYTPEEQYIIK